MSELCSVLVVDDEQSILTLAQHILEKNGYAIFTAASGGEALARFEQHRSEIALVVTDIVMPGMSGAELARRLQQMQPGLPVLFMSGTEVSPAETRPLLAKPFTPRELIDSVSALIGDAPRRKDVVSEQRAIRRRTRRNSGTS